MFSNATGSPFATGTNPVSNATADLNGDGHLDLLFTNYISDNVSVLLGNGTGSFVAATPVPVTNGPREVEAADLDGDGDIDFLATNYSGNNVTVALNNGNATFTTSSVAVGTVPRGLAIGDLDGDGDIDFVAANYQSNTVSVMLNNGNAAFAQAVGSPVATGTRPVAVALADFDGDHDVDIAVTSNNTNNVSILLNNGSGAFAAAPSAATGAGPRGIAAGDIDGDGDNDLVVANFSANTLSILLNNGAAGFAAGTPLTTGNNPYAVSLGDLDGDGDLDIAVSNSGSSSVSVFINLGSAVFTPATGSPFAVGVSPGGVVMGDFDGDGYLDLSSSNFGSNTTSILINASEHLVGTTGNDPLTGGIGNDLIEGLGGDDSIVGGDGHDRMFGGTGNDVLDGGNGIDAMAGDVGNDTYFVDNPSDVVTENPGAGTDTVQSSINYQLGPNVENLFLTGNADLQGFGNGLANSLSGNTGNNLIDGGAGADVMSGGAGNDTYFVDNVADAVIENAGQGTDAVFASANYGLTANVETLVLQGAADLQGFGNDLANSIFGNSGNNLIDGGVGADSMSGGAGNDVYFVDNAGDVVFENPGEGTDTVFASVNYTLTADVENLVLQAGADLQGFGNGLANALFGNSGNNLLDGGAGADSMSGGSGNDIYFVDNAGDAVNENVGEGNDTVFSTAHFALSANVENLVLQGGADLQGFGNGLANALFGNSGNNLLDGGGGADSMSDGAGNDVYFADNAGDAVNESAGQGSDAVFASVNYGLTANVETLVLQGGADLQGFGNGLANSLFGNIGNNLLDGGAGADAMSGGAGNDTYFVDNAADAVIENAGQGSDAVFASINYGLTANVETLVLQGGADLQGFGNALANSIFGNAGNNLIDGGAGADSMSGGAGNDTYFVDNAGDVVNENAGQGSDAVFASVNYGLTANIATMVLQGGADLQGFGNTLANSIFGNAGNNLIDGGAGADTMVGGLGNDTYFVDDGLDQVIENVGAGNDAIFTTAHFVLSANVETLVQQGSADLGGTGNALANAIFGNSGNNTLDGQGGADILTGNAGNDTFVFHAGQANGDTVVDFAGNGAAAGDSLQFVGYGPGATFTNIDATHWQVNYNAGASHDVITFTNAASIDATDFILV